MPQPTITRHCAEQAIAKGFTARQTWLAMTDPDIVYPSSRRYGHQERRIRDGIVLCVDKVTNTAITCYTNVVETELRPDQIANGDKIAS